MECDEYTLKKTDSYTYSKLLIKLAEFHLLKSSCFLITQNLISQHTLKKRIEKMLNPKKSKKNIGISSIVVLALIILTSMILLYGKINDRTSQNEILDWIKTRYAQILVDRNKVDIEKVPQNFIDALLVSEDRDFFKHKGIKLYNIVKASIFNLFHDRERWLGASTITQQLAKQLLNQPNEKTFERKFRELKTAKVLEKNYTKHEILEMYLNSIYFGNNAWGLHQAAHTYFGHSYEKLTLKEAALLVPSLTAPAKYNFIKNPQLAKARQARLINSMMKLGIVNSAYK
jgi:membrane peptidoglycan carboxypeptidase